MSYTHTLTRSWSQDGETALNYTQSVSADGRGGYSGEVAAGKQDQQINLAVDISQLKLLVIGSDQDLTIETNNPGGSSGTPADTLTLLANQPVMWQYGDVMDLPLSEDVTCFYVTNGGDDAANLNIRTLTDITP